MLKQVRDYLRQENIDAWFVYQFIDINPIYNKVLGTDKKVCSRRTFIIIPKEGEITLLHSQVDGGFEDLGLREVTYVSYDEFQELAKREFGKFKKVAMEFSPMSAIPHISKVDAGIVDFVRSLGLEVVSSGNLMQIVARLSDEEVASHLRCTKATDKVRRTIIAKMEKDLQAGKEVTEFSLQQDILAEIKKAGMQTLYEPQTTINENSARSHYAPSQDDFKVFRKGDLLLVDMWAKFKDEDIFADMTWMFYRGKELPKKMQEVFDTVKKARDEAIEFMRKKVKSGEDFAGWEVDKVARDIINEAGYGEYFIHRLGHSIGTFIHGNLAHLDNHENRDERLILPNHITSVEPGVYIRGEFGVRLEVDVLITEDDVKVTTEIQDEIYLLP